METDHGFVIPKGYTYRKYVACDNLDTGAHAEGATHLYIFVCKWVQLSGENSHHIIEATFKAFARALRQATEHDERRRGSIPRYMSWQLFETLK